MMKFQGPMILCVMFMLSPFNVAEGYQDQRSISPALLDGQKMHGLNLPEILKDFKIKKGESDEKNLSVYIVQYAVIKERIRRLLKVLHQYQAILNHLEEYRDRDTLGDQTKHNSVIKSMKRFISKKEKRLEKLKEAQRKRAVFLQKSGLKTENIAKIPAISQFPKNIS